jgi:hypothetical protein
VSEYIFKKDDNDLMSNFSQSMKDNGFCIIQGFVDKDVIRSKLSKISQNFSRKNDVRRTGITKLMRSNFQRLDIGDYAQINARFCRMITQFAWNKDSDFYNEIQALINFRNSFLKLEPQNFVYKINGKEYCDLPKFLQYPIGGGFMNRHIDDRGEEFKSPNFLINLSKQGEDFDSNGVYYIDKNQKMLDLEPILDVGDLYAHDTKTPHGVQSIDADKELDIETLCGRFSINLSLEPFIK